VALELIWDVVMIPCDRSRDNISTAESSEACIDDFALLARV
jgi:hypothetical protein